MEPGAPSPFLRIPESEWLCANAVCFVISDWFPVSRGHVPVIARVVPTFFNATTFERSGLIERVGKVEWLFDGRLQPKFDGCKVGIIAGATAGWTVLLCMCTRSLGTRAIRSTPAALSSRHS